MLSINNIDSDTKQNETDTAQCISEKEKHMSEGKNHMSFFELGDQYTCI